MATTADDTRTLDYWQNFFRCADSDIFKIVEQAILVAAADRPKQLRARRDRITELLFTFHHQEDDVVDDGGCCLKRREGEEEATKVEVTSADHQVRTGGEVSDLASVLDQQTSDQASHSDHEVQTGGEVRRVNNIQASSTAVSVLDQEISLQAKLEASKRKLHQGYEQAENAKRQRRIQVIHDMPTRNHHNPNHLSIIAKVRKMMIQEASSRYRHGE